MARAAGAPTSDAPTTGAAATDAPVEASPKVRTYPLRLTDLAPPRRGPTRLRIDRLGVDASITPVGNTATGALDVPPRPDVVGWYKQTALPGQPGSVVLAAHVDLHGVRGVFFDLVTLDKGDRISVDVDGVPHRYRVVARSQVAKSEIGKAGIFDATGPAQLVLVTCGGSFDRAAHSYRDNIVVRAVPA